MKKSSARKDYLNASEAVDLLGVRRQTLYAYVSRGLVRSVPEPGSRLRLYSREDLERLHQRSRAGTKPDAIAATLLDLGHPVVPTSITEITPQGPSYRGRLAVSLARQGVCFEQVAELLWTGLWHDSPLRWALAPGSPDIVPLLRGIDRPTARHQLVEVFVIVVMQLAMGRGPVQERLISGRPLDAARNMIQVLTGCFGLLAERGTYVPPRRDRSVAESLLVALGRPVKEPDRELLDATLVLLADHELSPGTFAARVAASAGCPLHSCVAAAIAGSSGTAVGRRYDRIEEFLNSCGSTSALVRSAQRLFESGRELPGFDHPVYPRGDPRATQLFDLLRGRRDPARELARILALVDAVEKCFGLKPRHELAVVAVSRCLALAPGAPSALFVLARIAGWVAHVLEQRLSSTLIRPRARFVQAGAPTGRQNDTTGA